MVGWLVVGDATDVVGLIHHYFVMSFPYGHTPIIHPNIERVTGEIQRPMKLSVMIATLISNHQPIPDRIASIIKVGQNEQYHTTT